MTKHRHTCTHEPRTCGCEVGTSTASCGSRRVTHGRFQKQTCCVVASENRATTRRGDMPYASCTHARAHTHKLFLYNSTPALCNCRVAERARQATPPRNQGLLEGTRTAFFFPLPLSTHILLLQSASFTFIIFFPLLFLQLTHLNKPRFVQNAASNLILHPVLFVFIKKKTSPQSHLIPFLAPLGCSDVVQRKGMR